MTLYYKPVRKKTTVVRLDPKRGIIFVPLLQRPAPSRNLTTTHPSRLIHPKHHQHTSTTANHRSNVLQQLLLLLPPTVPLRSYSRPLHADHNRENRAQYHSQSDPRGSNGRLYICVIFYDVGVEFVVLFAQSCCCYFEACAVLFGL